MDCVSPIIFNEENAYGVVHKVSQRYTQADGLHSKQQSTIQCNESLMIY